MKLETDLAFPTALEAFLLDASMEREAIEIIRAAYLSDSSEEPKLNEPEGSIPELMAPPTPVAAEASLPTSRLDAQPERPLLPPGESPVPPDDTMAIRCLGPFEISRRGESMPSGWRAKGRELLAYLVAHPAGAPKDRIIEELWADVEPARASLRFNKCATRIRALARGTEDSRMYIERVGDSAYRLEETAWWVDAWEFERLIREAVRSEETSDAVKRFRDAIALYGAPLGPLLESRLDRLEQRLDGMERSIADVREWLAFREGRERPPLWMPRGPS
jgi:hypothetical protein